MNGNIIFSCSFLLSSILVMAGCTDYQRKEQNTSPNILIIYADDLGYGDLSSYGGEIPTPNIDKIGEEGIKFTDFYVSAPACTPSRYSLLTGSYPQRSVHGLTGALMPIDTGYLDPNEQTLAEYLNPNYKTALFGKWHLGVPTSEDMPDIHGFDIFTGFKGGCIDYFTHVYGQMEHDWYVNGNEKKEKGYSTDLITNHTIDYIDHASNQDSPFFIFLSYNAPHFGKTDPENIEEFTIQLGQPKEYHGYPIVNTLQAPPEYLNRFSHIENSYRRTYAAMVSNMDDNIGKVMDELKEKNLFDNTIIWFISDNGGYTEKFQGHANNGGLKGEKATLWEGGIRVPSVLQWKKKIRGGQEISAPVCNTDVLPTLLSILKIPVPDQEEQYVDGIDLSSLIFEGIETERNIFWKYRDQTAIRSGKWKLVNNEMLFDLKSDMWEKNDIALENRLVVEKLKDEFEKIEQKINREKRKVHSFSENHK